ncbi:hypothetical protein HY837_06460 [archaeon]|nr:hypothetical protein [archaeon]
MLKSQPETVTYLVTLRDNYFNDDKDKELQEHLKGRAKLIEEQKEKSKKVFEEARRRFQKYNIAVANEFYMLSTMLLESKKEEFEKLFGVKLVWQSYVVNNINKGSSTHYDWRMNGKPKIPTDLEDLITSVGLNSKVHLTD